MRLRRRLPTAPSLEAMLSAAAWPAALRDQFASGGPSRLAGFP